MSKSAPNRKRANNETVLQGITEQNQLKSPFLRLPGEIRNKIYHYALGDHEIYAIGDGPDFRSSAQAEKKQLSLPKFLFRCRPSHQFAWDLSDINSTLALNLPLTCRQIRSELGTCFVFANNSFGLAMPYRKFNLLLECFTPVQRESIETVKTSCVKQPIIPQKAWLEDLTEFGGLKKVVLRDLGGLNEVEMEETKVLIREIVGREGLVVEVESIC